MEYYLHNDKLEIVLDGLKENKIRISNIFNTIAYNGRNQKYIHGET